MRMIICLPCALRILRILLPVTLFTWAIPWESRRITPIWDGVRPFLANLQMLSWTWKSIKRTHKQFQLEKAKNWLHEQTESNQKKINHEFFRFTYILRRDLQPAWRSPLIWLSWGGNTLSVKSHIKLIKHYTHKSTSIHDPSISI